jgi:hypothetical protein
MRRSAYPCGSLRRAFVSSHHLSRQCGTLEQERSVNSSRDSGPDRLLRTAAWLYVVPRVATGILILAALGLAAFLVFVQMALVILRHLGA